MYSKSIPLRVLLIATFVLQTVAAVSLTVWLAWRNEQSSITEMNTYVQIESFRKIQDRLTEYLNSAAVINRLNHQTLTRARTSDPAESLTAQFLQQRDLSAAVPVTAIYFGSTEGQFLGLVSEQDKNWSIARTHRGTDWRYATYAMNASGQATRLLDLGKPYDPRQRPWYTNALKQGKSRWSVVYQDFQEPTLVMTMSEPAYNPQGKLLGVVGVDITLTQLSTFLRSLLMPKLALLLVVDSNGQLVATSTAQKPFVVRNNIAQRISAVDLPDPTVQATTPVLKKALAQWKASHATQPETFNVQGIPYTLRLAPLQDDYGLDFVVIAAMPNDTFQQQIANHSRETLLLCVAVLMTAILLGLIAARRLSQALHQFLDSGQAIADGNLNQSIPQSRVQELNQLAQTFNRMAQHLRQAFDELELRVQERTAALKQSEEKFAKVFYAHPNGIALSKLHDGQFIDANDSALKLFGYQHHEFIGQTSTELGIWISNGQPNPTPTHPPQYPVRALECCIRTQGGELKTILYSADLIELNGEPYLISLMQDITDRKRAEDALRRSEEKFAKVFHANPNPMTISRVEDGYFLDANESAANFLETDVCHIVGHTSSALQIWVDL
ncbi:MAG TPA: cache domain-containing protein, partial [Stenomitos sp.]